MKFSKEWLKGLSTTKKVLLGSAAVFIVAAAASQPATINTSNTGNKSSDSQTQQHKKPVITTHNVDENEVIPFSSTTVDDPNLAKGTTKITTAGVNGRKTLTYEVTYTD